jgi:YegS/Rv2252/BmrU family lipid kinase
VKPLFIVNPKSGGGRTERTFDETKRVIARRLGDFDVVMTERSGHAISLAEDGAKEGRDMIVAVGGDGTLSECANGILRAGKEKAIKLGMLGQGTGGDFRKTLGFEHRLDAYVDALHEKKVRAIDVGRAKFQGHDGKDKTHFFVNILSAGLGGLVDGHVSRASRALGGTAAYFVSSLRALVEIVPGKLRCTVTYEGKEREERITSYMLAICNGRYFGSGMHVAPMAQVDDGKFEVVSMDAPNKAAFALHSQSIYKGAHLEKKGVVHFPCSKIRIDLENEEARKTFLLDVDGEPLGALPVEVEVVPHALQLIVPPE